MRVHLPASWADLESLAAGGLLSPRTGFAVDGDDDEASETARSLAEDAADPSYRVVVAADVPDSQAGLMGDGAVAVRCGIPLGWVAAVFVDEQPPGDDLLWFAPDEVSHLVAAGRANLGT